MDPDPMKKYEEVKIVRNKSKKISKLKRLSRNEAKQDSFFKSNMIELVGVRNINPEVFSESLKYFQEITCHVLQNKDKKKPNILAFTSNNSYRMNQLYKHLNGTLSTIDHFNISLPSGGVNHQCVFGTNVKIRFEIKENLAKKLKSYASDGYSIHTITIHKNEIIHEKNRESEFAEKPEKEGQSSKD